MLKSFRKSGSNPIVWSILAILVVGLIGFGGRVSSGIGASGIASVGGESVTTDDYVRAMQNEVQGLSQQFGQQLTMQQALAFGIDQTVLAKLVNAAALDAKAHDLGISVGDGTVRDNLLRTEAFKGVTGKFDPDTYRFALDRINMTPAEYDLNVREGSARDLIRTGISAGTTMPDSAATTLLAYSGEKRVYDWVILDASNLPTPVAAPTEVQAMAYYTAHNDQFMTPETREISYLSLKPADLVDQVTVSDEQLHEAYDSRIDEFDIPETRAVERLAFATEADAITALARLTSGAVTFEALVAERDLELADLDLGIIGKTALDPQTQVTVFSPTNPGIYGPAPSLLGPALFRVNAIFAAQSTTFEQAVPQLKQELALVEAAGLVADEAGKLDDLLAGGATMAEIDSETAFTLANISWYETITEGIAADPAFQAEAAALSQDEDRDPIDLADGGVAVLRLDSITAPALRPFNQVSAQAIAALKAEIESAKIAEYAASMQAEITAAKTLAALAAEKSLTLHQSDPTLRTATIADAPTELINKLFEIKVMEAALLSGTGRADLIQLTAVTAFDPTAEANKAVMSEANRQLSEAAGNDLFAVFAQAAQDEAGVSINASLVQSVLARLQ